jgi:hypothetical protein
MTMVMLVALAGGFTATGCASVNKRNESTFRLYEEVNPQGEISRVQTIDLPFLARKVTISPYAVLNERDLMAVRLVQTTEGLALYLKFDPHGTVVLDEVTTRIRGSMLVAFADDRPIAAWVVEKRSSQGELLVKPELPDEEIMVLAEGLRRAAHRYQSMFLRQ